MIASAWGLADINATSARHILVQWENDANTLNDINWNIAHNNVANAIDRDPMNPRLLTLKGNLQEWKIYLENDSADKNHYMSMALEYYRHAAKLRPSWPYTWGHISLVKYRMGEIDQEFYQAIDKVILTGPWEHWVQQVVAETGLSAWQSLDQIYREKIVRNIHRGITSQPQIMLSILKKYGQLNMVCYQKKVDPLIYKYCENKSGASLDRESKPTFLRLSDKLKKI